MVMNIGNREIATSGHILRIARLDADIYQPLSDPEPILKELRTNRIRVDLFTFLQGLPDTTPKYNYPMVWDNLAVLTVSTFEHWWNTQIGFKARNKAKQAEKKRVVIREVPFNSQLVHGIWKIYNESPVRQGRHFSHYGKNLDTVWKEEATYLENSIFIGAFLDDELIGFIKLVTDESHTQAGLMNIVSMIQHRDKAPTNALVAQAVRSCANRGISYLVYANFCYGNKLKDGIIDFKQRNGFKRIELPRYYVPVTWLGMVAFRLGFHRRLIDRIPERMLSSLRNLRNAWYKRTIRAHNNFSQDGC
jgi:hypothetical protein